jgi:hypothetical protein
VPSTLSRTSSATNPAAAATDCGATDEHQPVRRDGKQEIEQRAGQYHRRSGFQRLAVKSPRRLIGAHRRFALVEHFDVTAQRQRGDDKLGTIDTEVTRPQRFAETDGKTQHLDTQPPRHPEVAELMDGNQHADGQDKGQ